MNVGELIQRVQSLYSKGVNSDDSRLTNRHIYNKLLTVRNMLVFRKLNKKQKISAWNYVFIPCIELIKAPAHECPCLPPVGCEILKSKYPLPKPITNLEDDMVLSVTSIEGSISYDKTTFEAKRFSKGKKFTSKRQDYYIRNGHLYITWVKGPRVVSMNMLPKDPIEAINFKGYCDGECNETILITPDDELLDILYRNIKKSLINPGELEEFFEAVEALYEYLYASGFIASEITWEDFIEDMLSCASDIVIPPRDIKPDVWLEAIKECLVNYLIPISVSNCEDCTSPLDMEFPIDEELIEPLIQMSVEELVGQFGRITEDKSNNTSDDTAAQLPYGGRRPQREQQQEDYE